MAAEKAKDAITFLKKTPDVLDSTVYDHLVDIVGKILLNKPVGAVDLLETSYMTKKDFTAPTPTPSQAKPLIKQKPKDTAKAVAVSELFIPPQPEIDPDTGEAGDLPVANEYTTENVLGDAALFASVGVGFSESEWYSIMLTLKKLGEDTVKELNTVRFFGKFFATGGEYYVFESTLKNEPEPPPESEDPYLMPPEEFGTGANSYTYWVTTKLGGPYTQLPDVTPTMITQARKIKKFLTGDLKAEVTAYPVFPGKEAEYLRAQIARIAATTTICPGGFFAVGDDEVTLDNNEEFAPLGAAAMSETANWSHRYAHIKDQGRCVWWAPPPPEEEEEEEYEEPTPEASPALLNSLDKDTVVNGGTAWSALKSSQIPSLPHQTVGMRSNLWPGAYAVCLGDKFSNVYIGWGVKNERLPPTMPPVVNEEWLPFTDKEGVKITCQELTDLPPPPPPPEPEEDEEEEED
ncbi:putative splicing factor, arginine/serine-rich 4 [Cymbomonas tetramitiformis]|uniref:Splicing factor, arginine/serine-rich 4 n=1 Tax=Cymbomonas tetramitiformis TaxID=36881 RepID=A0AAE0FT90_9CHLO|nr:putative splicing factor, arginine/serine-rich 4 [Cymbomonas tetramitiformis]KAK3265479.1 putative splicing factor, arginine/serine-rich 4 [Cymbomonas tetramitiformis]|eukprot:gene6818-8146_t